MPDLLWLRRFIRYGGLVSNGGPKTERPERTHGFLRCAG